MHSRDARGLGSELETVAELVRRDTSIRGFSYSVASRHYSYRVPAVVAVTGTMAVPPECNEEWFELVPNLLSHEGWEVAIDGTMFPVPLRLPLGGAHHQVLD